MSMLILVYCFLDSRKVSGMVREIVTYYVVTILWMSIGLSSVGQACSPSRLDLFSLTPPWDASKGGYGGQGGGGLVWG